MACSGCAKRRAAIRKAALAAKHGFVAKAQSLGLMGSEIDRKQAEANRRKGLRNGT